MPKHKKKHKKVTSDGSFGPRYGAMVRKKYREVMDKMRDKDTRCPRCQTKGSIRRLSTGIWHCKKCEATFTGGAYLVSTPRGEESLRVAKRKQRELEIEE